MYQIFRKKIQSGATVDDRATSKLAAEHATRDSHNGRLTGVYNLCKLGVCSSVVSRFRWLSRTKLRKASVITSCVLCYCLLHLANDVVVYRDVRTRRVPGAGTSIRLQDADPSLPKLKVVAFDLSPPTTNDSNLMNPGPDFAVRLDPEGTRICCNYSVSKLVFSQNACQVNVFGSRLTLKGPWNWAVYGAAREAYLLGADYFLILNDRSRLRHNWARQYIDTLLSLDPPNVGVALRNNPVGPRIVFLHRSHIDIFGFVYPWPIRTSSTYVFLENLYPDDMRLDVDSPIPQLADNIEGPSDDVLPWIKDGRYYLSRYLARKRLPQPPRDNQVKVISMSLYYNTPKYIEGAIRNAQLAPVFFPDWSIRVYVPHPNTTEAMRLRDDVIVTLRRLGAQIRYVTTDVGREVAPMMWRFLVAEDPEVDVFLMHDSDSRLGERLYHVINAWLRTNASVYCMRDHPWHSASPMSGGLWAARRAQFSRLMKGEFLAEVVRFNDSYGQDMAFLSRKVWPKIRRQIYCHDSVSCYHWINAHPWPAPRRGLEHVGEIYDEHHVPYQSNRVKLNQTQQHAYCESLPRISGSG